MSMVTIVVPNWRRTLAWAIDYFVVALYLAVLFFAFFLIDSDRADRNGLFSSAERAQVSSFLLITLPVVLYAALTEASSLRGTLGKRMTGLLVESIHGGRLTLGRSLVRSSLKFLPWELGHTFVQRASRMHWQMDWVPEWVQACLWLAIGLAAIYLGGLFTGARRPLYDLIAGSRVVVADEAPRLRPAASRA